ncbi:hypothetical protein E4U41_004857 [Claviceps citrina]|nr:hypothetical protein E4U41_004857 [Claviceps citrina]
MKLYPDLPPDLAAWAQRQPLFLTASAGTHAPHVNVSPKGLPDTHFAVLSPTRCAYVDRTGSGCETIAHAYENGRLCLMFMSFGAARRAARPTLDRYSKRCVEENTVRSYQRANNVRSIDGLPGLRASREDAGETLWLGDLKARMARLAAEREAMAVGFAIATLLALLLRRLGL